MPTLRRLGYVALVIGFAQVVFGAIVRISGSGMGCGDNWPDCYGSFTPANTTPSLLIEITHRYGAVVLSLAIAALIAAAFLNRGAKGGGVSGRGGVLRPALLAGALVVAAAIFGAVSVKLGLRALVVVVHLSIAMAVLAVLVVVIVRAGGFGAVTVSAPVPRTFRAARVAVGLTIAAVLFGALTANVPGAPIACQGFPWCRSVEGGGTPLAIQITHRVMAFFLLGHLFGMNAGSRKRKEPLAIRTAVGVALAAVILQWVIAAGMVEMHLPTVLRSLHQAVGTAVWISVVALTALAAGRRDAEAVGAEVARESPSRGEFATPEGVST